MAVVTTPATTILNIELVKGSTFTHQPTCKKWVDGTATVINLSGATITYKVARHADAVDLVSLSVGSGITIISAGDGRCNIALSTTNTALAPGDYFHQLTVAVGGETIACLVGTLTITRGL